MNEGTPLELLCTGNSQTCFVDFTVEIVATSATNISTARPFTSSATIGSSLNWRSTFSCHFDTRILSQSGFPMCFDRICLAKCDHQNMLLNTIHPVVYVCRRATYKFPNCYFLILLLQAIALEVVWCMILMTCWGVSPLFVVLQSGCVCSLSICYLYVWAVSSILLRWEEMPHIPYSSRLGSKTRVTSGLHTS